MVWTKLLLITSSVFVIYVRDVISSEQTNTCFLKCAQDMLKCRRFETMGLLSEMDCCDKYTLCYIMCQPEAVVAPSCSTKDKRGSWNKRQASQGSSQNREWLELFTGKDDLGDENQFYV